MSFATPFLRTGRFNGGVVDAPYSVDAGCGAAPVMAARAWLLARVLARLDVALGVELHDPDELLGFIAQRVASPRGPSVGQVRERLWQRHGRRRPASHLGLSIPHAAVPALQSHQLLYVRLARPLTDDGGSEILDALALLIPRPGLAADRLLLDQLHTVFSNPANLALLRGGTSPAAVRAGVAGLA